MNQLLLEIVTLKNLLNFTFGKSIIVDTQVIHFPTIVGIVFVTPPAELKSLPVTGTDL